ncbi:MAG TPA: pilus assembly PilX N-terminal domain-containing protein [Nitrospira sp.]|nr:pilus assembly PilX N-terminal domain-containing protein [Nitrospira sp.]
MSQRTLVGNQQGIALLGAMVIVLLLSLMAATLLNLSGQEVVSAGAGNQVAVAQQLADAAGELVVAWFHDPQSTARDPRFGLFRERRQSDVQGSPSFFDPNGRSQFVGTSDQPDVLLQAENPTDERLLNDPEVGLFRAMSHLGQVKEVKVYAPSNPGLLCTVDATIATRATPSVRQSVSLQLAAWNLRPLRAAVQVSRQLGEFRQGSESPVKVHWGDLRVGDNLVLSHESDIPAKSAIAVVTGQSYDETAQHEDPWMEAWVGGQVQVTQPASNEASELPSNLHERQSPIPGVRLDEWTYEELKRMAKRFGRYFAIDREGLLYPQGVVEPGRGLSPDEVLKSQGPGDQQGLIFIDTLDQLPPRVDNLGVLQLHASYLEGMVVMQGHIFLNPRGTGAAIKAFTPPRTSPEGTIARMPIQLSGIQLSGVLYATGNITVTGQAKVYGAVVTGGTITGTDARGALEVWYDHDLGQGWFRGVPVVYRAPGTWVVKY